MKARSIEERFLDARCLRSGVICVAGRVAGNTRRRGREARRAQRILTVCT